jgi:hypothetical protein
MKRTILAIALAALSLGAAAAADQATPEPAKAPVLEDAAPPALNDPGVQTESPRPAETATEALPKPDTRLVRDRASRSADNTPAGIEASSDAVSERTEGTDRIREYRRNGILRMVRIQPRSGPEQIYIDANGDGRLDRDLIEGPVSPVYFTIYEWN